MEAASIHSQKEPDNRPPGIVLAEIEDEDEIYSHLLQLHEENGMFSVDEGRVREFIRSATERRGGIIALIRGNEIEASLGMVMDQWWYTLDWCLNERWCFVHPRYRKKNHARRLVDYGKWCSDNLSRFSDVNVPLQMGIMSSTRTEAKERLYARQLTRVGGFFMYRGERNLD